jgi:CRP/FNR family transcriptional regulator, cyclic AMP receptor protein
MKARGEMFSEILVFLRSMRLFSQLSESSILALARASRFHRVDKGKILFFQVDPSESAYIVRSGQISIMLNSIDGREMVINEMRAGDLFGELGVLTNKNRSTSAKARSKSELLIIPGKILSSIVDSDPHFARSVLEVTASRLQTSGEREGALAFMDAQARLARLLLELDQQEKERDYITISQNELADRTGLIRQTVADALGKWRRKSLVITGRGRIVLLDRKALEEIENQLIV